MNIEKPLLLSIIEVGVTPDLTALYRECGFTVETLTSMRRALQFMKRHKPQVIVCEFIYLPTYSMRISNLEPMLAALERYCYDPAIVIQATTEQRMQLSRLDLSRWRHAIVLPAGEEETIKRSLKAWRDPVPTHT